MSRRRVAVFLVSTVFLFLIGTTAHSLFSDIESAEAEVDSPSEGRESRFATYTSGSGHVRYHIHSEPADVGEVVDVSPDAGVEDLITRLLRDCHRRGRECTHPDGGFSPPPPP